MLKSVISSGNTAVYFFDQIILKYSRGFEYISDKINS